MKRLFALLLCLSLMGCADTLMTTGVILKTIKDAMPDAPVQTPTPKPNPVPIVPTPQPPPGPPPAVPTPAPSPAPAQITTHVDVWNGDLIPDQMRQFVTGNWSDNQLYWALFTCYGSHVGDFSQDAAALGAQCGAIRDWFSKRISDIGARLRVNPGMTATLIVNDANDRGGLFMIDNIRAQLLGMGVNPNQLEDGQVYRP